MKEEYEIITVQSGEQYRQLAGLFREYERYLGFELTFQNFSEELKQLPAMYGPPDGRAYLLEQGSIAFGCVAVRKLEDGVGEIKRMYLKPYYRRKGFGKVLMDLALEVSRELGYRKVRLDTLDTMKAAIAVYKKAGFYEIPKYRENPFENAVFMEKKLMW